MAAPAKRRMSNGWRNKEPARANRTRSPRTEYALTLDEWDRLGGTEVPGVGKYSNPIPAFQADCALVWAEVADRLGIHMLTINWPKVASLTITAEAL